MLMTLFSLALLTKVVTVPGRAQDKMPDDKMADEKMSGDKMAGEKMTKKKPKKKKKEKMGKMDKQDGKM